MIYRNPVERWQAKRRMIHAKSKRRGQRFSQVERLDQRLLLAGDLVAQWRAEDLVGAVDDDGNIPAWTDTVAGIEARVVGSPTVQAGVLGGRALVSLDASDEEDAFEVVPADSPLSGADDFSAAVFFKTDSSELVGATNDWFENTGLVDANQLGLGRDWGLSINSAGRVSAGMSGGLGGPDPVSIYSDDTGLNDGEPHTAIVTRSGANLALYVDGELAAQTSAADPDPRGDSGIMIGGLLSRANYFSGQLGEVRLYDGQLTEQQAAGVSDEMHAFFSNQAPVANDDTYTLEEDTAFFFVPTPNGLLANDTDADGDSLTVELVTPPEHGTLSLEDDGSFLYDSDENFFGTDQFTYSAVDFRPGQEATVTINVTSVRDEPVPVDDVYAMRPGETLSVFGLVGILANDTNVDRASLSAVLVDDVGSGSLNLSPDGGFTYDPQGFAGRTQFTYRADDGSGQLSSNVGTVTIAVTTPPVAMADQLTVDEDTSQVLNVLANDTDAEGDPLTISIEETTSQGTLELQDDGTLFYTPAEHYHGPDSFTYRLSDGFDFSEVVTASIDVVSINDPPVPREDGYVVLPDQTLAIPVQGGVLANDSDVEGEPLSATVAQGPSNGSLEMQSDGSFVYTPNAGFTGNDSFTYIASDGTDQTEEVPVSVGVQRQPFVISEFMAVNLETIETRIRELPGDRFRGERLTPDYIEIQNLLSFPIDLGGMHLTDDADELEKWSFPPGTTIEPGGYLVVFASGENVLDTELDESGFLHTNFRLSSDGEYLAITAQDGTVLHEFADAFPRQFLDISYGVTEEGTGYLLTPTLGEANSGETLDGIVQGPTIDTDHGFFNEPVVVSITNHDADGVVRYTLDGSEPTLENSTVYSEPITVAETTVVRARAFRDGSMPSRTDTRSYIFLRDVVNQSLDGEPPEGWPERWGVNDTDYGMDPDIVNDPEWGPLMIDALTEIPTMSVVTDLDNLFDRSTGIISRASSDGFAWERPASLELVHPDGAEGFQHNIGIRIRGGFSRSSGNPKHAFRVFFDTVYGDGWLDYALFPEDPTAATTFAKIDLRTTQNYSWAFQGDSRNTFLRDIYSRDLQLAMGHQSTRGEYYHLYINGQYFGLFQTDERPSAQWGASYYGGDPEDYDVVHNDPRQNGATDGTTDAYERLFAFFDQDNGLGDVNMEDYYRAQGRNPDGTRNPDYERLLDVDNLIDYMVITYYTSDADGPGSKFTRPGLNNIFTVFNRENPDGFKFVEHDSEHSLDTGNAAGNSQYNMVSPLVNNGRRFPNFNPHYMHEQLANSNSDYLIRFQDRVSELFAEGGLLDNETVVSMLESREAEFDMAIIAESARWGDSKANRPFTKDHWERAVRTAKAFPQRRGSRTQEVLQQLERVGWWDFDTPSPVLSNPGGQVEPGTQVAVTLDGEGTIFVTTDGSDPRLSGGDVNPDAMMLNSGDTIRVESGMHLRARNRNGTSWSPVAEATYFTQPVARGDNLRVSELHYNPAPPSAAEVEAGFDDKDDFEFIELLNISDESINLTGARLRRIIHNSEEEGVDFAFADGSILNPGERLVVVEDLEAFSMRYGEDLPVAGQWSGGLGNGGETITVQYNDGSQHQFTYGGEWYEAADAMGASLEVRDPRSEDLASWNLAASWTPSAQLNGTPGTSSRLPGDSNGDGVFDSADLVAVAQVGEFEDGIAGNSTFQEGDWNGDGDFDTRDFVFVFSLGVYQSGAAAKAMLQANPSTTDSVFSEVEQMRNGARWFTSRSAETTGKQATDRVFSESGSNLDWDVDLELEL